MVTEPTDRPRHYLREWRLEKKMLQGELAEKAGTYASIISRIETGKHGLELELLLRLCWALDIMPGELFQHPRRKSLDRVYRFHSDDEVNAIARHVIPKPPPRDD